MFNFFKSSKKSPIASPSETPRSDESTHQAGSDFVLIGSGGNPNHPGSLYPSAQLPPQPVPAVPPPHAPNFNRQYSLQIANYTQSVPFKLNPVLSSNGNESDFVEYQLREISQMLNQLSNPDYDFKLERSIVDQI